MKNELVFVKDHFAWERSACPAKELELAEGDVLMPYRGGLAPLLLGDDAEIWELHQLEEQNAGLKSTLGYLRKLGGVFQICAGELLLGEALSIETAVRSLRNFSGKVPAWHPEYLYRKPAGRLLPLLYDPESVLVVLCGWKEFRRQGYELQTLNADQRDQFAGFLSLPYWTLKNYREDQKNRTEPAKFPFAETVFGMRTEAYAANSLRYDSVVHVLSPECAANPASVEYFKTAMLELAERYDLDAIFVKEKTSVYALGCRHEDFLGEFHGYPVRQLANFRQQDVLNADTPLEALFDFMDKIKNNDYVVMPRGGARSITQFVEEALPRPEFRLGSMMRALMYYREESMLYRCQWGRIESPRKGNSGKFRR